jgi:hypothetical protein
MPLLLVVITAAALFGVLALGTVAWLTRGNRRMAVQTEGQHGPPVALRHERVAPPRGQAAGVVPAPDAPLPKTFTHLNKTQAEELLDWLQAHGHVNCELTYDEQNGFTVRRG